MSLKRLLQGAVLMSTLTAATLMAAPRDLIIDTDPGADDVVACCWPWHPLTS